MNNTESFVLYESVYKQFEILKKRKPAVATDFIEAIMEYGLYGVVPDEESDVWLYGFEQSITSIQRAKDRYIAAVENGSKGGRPSKNLNTVEIGEAIAHGICNYFGVTYKTAKPAPAPTPKPVTSDKLYRVQVGAYRVKANAEAMLAKLKAAGFDGYIKQ